jgi:hypothetical protein
VIDQTYQSDPSQEAVKSYIHVDQVEGVLRLEKLKVIHTPDLSPVGIDYLLIQEGFFQEHLPRAERRRPKIDRLDGIGNKHVIDFQKTFPGEEDNFTIRGGTQEDVRHRRIDLSDVPHKVEDLADGTSLGINDFSPQKFAQIQKNLGFLMNRHEPLLPVLVPIALIWNMSKFFLRAVDRERIP